MKIKFFVINIFASALIALSSLSATQADLRQDNGMGGEGANESPSSHYAMPYQPSDEASQLSEGAARSSEIQSSDVSRKNSGSSSASGEAAKLARLKRACKKLDEQDAFTRELYGTANTGLVDDKSTFAD